MGSAEAVRKKDRKSEKIVMPLVALIVTDVVLIIDSVLCWPATQT